MCKLLEVALDRVGNLLGEVANIVVVETRHRDAAVGGHVDVRLLSQRLGLRGVQTREAALTVN